MIADLEPYAAMRESGNPALGKVPEHWRVEPITRIGRLFRGQGGSKDDETSSGIPCVRYGDLYTRHEFFITATHGFVSAERAGAYMSIKRGDVLFASSGETIEDIGRSAVNLMSGDVRCGGDLIVLRPTIEVNPRFLGYAADGPAARHQKASMGRGFTVVHIYGSELKRLVLALPPLSEQAAIVRFLDHADRRICRYIRVKQKLIGLLEEQRRTIIERAVTRGLDDKVDLKPSGMEWFGDIPKHWEVLALKRVLRRLVDCEHKTAPAVDDSEFRVVRTSAVRNGKLRLDGTYCTTPEAYQVWTQRAVPKPGDVIFTREAPAGEACVVPDAQTLCLGQRTVLMKVQPRNYDPEFLVHMIYAGPPRERIRVASQGSTVDHFNMDDIGSMYVLRPPLGEQEEILDHIHFRTERLNDAMNRAEREIALLGEYRTRLIADVVTGKLDVREAAARLPAELEPSDEYADRDLDETEGDLDPELEAVEE